ncbi:MAG: hypothetical protein EZS28_047664, partial [Streblomastix strix]
MNPGKLKHAGKWTLGAGGAAVGLHALNKHDAKRDKKQGRMNESFNDIMNNTELFESIARKHLNNLNEYSAIISKINPYSSIGNVKVPKNKLPKLFNEVKKPGRFKILNKKYGLAAGALALGMIGVRSANNGMIKKYNLKNKLDRGHMDNTILYNPKTANTKYVGYNRNVGNNPNNDNLFEKVVEDSKEFYQMVKGKDGVYYQKGKRPIDKTIKRITDTAKKHKKALIAGTAAATIAGTVKSGFNKAKGKGKELLHKGLSKL